jgi:hypothetical protein
MWRMSPPAASRCPQCLYLPASATVICVACGHDRREPEPKAAHCPYRGKPCDCGGLKPYCMTEVA